MRAQLGEIAWLDKVKQNFSEEQFYKDMARDEEHNLSNQYITSYNGDVPLTAAGRVEQVTNLMEAGIISNTQAMNVLSGAAQDAMVYGSGSVLVSSNNQYTTASNHLTSFSWMPQGSIYQDQFTVRAEVDPVTDELIARQIFYNDGRSELSNYNGERQIRSLTGDMVECQTSNGDIFTTNCTQWVRVP